MPRQLDKLYRFLDHDDGNEDCVWNIGGGSLENSKRYYRVMYEEDEKKEWELIIDTNESKKVWIGQIDEFKNHVVDWMKSKPLSAYFVRSLFELFVLDPWFSYSNVSETQLCLEDSKESSR
jgi:hypothetical protein